MKEGNNEKPNKQELNSILKDWLPKEWVMEFFNYKATQMAVLEKNPEIKIAMVGRRKFYHAQSIRDFLESKIVKH